MKCKLVLKNNKGKIVDEMDGSTMSDTEFNTIINAPFIKNEVDPANELYLFLSQENKENLKELPYRILKYNHNLKMSYVINQLLVKGISTATRSLIILSSIDKYERSYKKSVINFTQSDMNNLTDDWLATGTSSSYNIARGLQELYKLIAFCREKNIKYDSGLEIHELPEVDKMLTKGAIKNKNYLSHDKLLTFLNNPKYSLEARMILYLIYKGAVLTSTGDELGNIRLCDIDVAGKRIYIEKGFKGSKYLPIHESELQFIRKFKKMKEIQIRESLILDYKMEYPVEEMYIFMKRREFSVGIEPVKTRTLRYRLNTELTNLASKEERRLIGLKNIINSGFASEYTYKIDNGKDPMDSLMETMRQFSDIGEGELEDYSKVDHNLYTRKRYILSTYL
ncbi:hypothetical protein [Lactobacillus taiwanensis]|uniref:hypothetical protein n=1 Tax=Lactobacillus taiwanensis TaxID=508451 RepID=UPI00322033A7